MILLKILFFHLLKHYKIESFNGLQGVSKLMAPSIACNSKKTKTDWFMIELLLNSQHFSAQALMLSGILHIALSGISAEKQHQAYREFSMRVALTQITTNDAPKCRFQ